MHSEFEKLMSDASQLKTVGDLVRWGASCLTRNDVYFGHGTDNAADESRVLVFHALSLDYEVPDYFYNTRVTQHEKDSILELFKRRIQERVPASYLTHESWFAGLKFYVDSRVLVPRSPFAELIVNRFSPWLGPTEPNHILDLCSGSACIAIACAYAFEGALIDASDIDPEALEVARINVQRHHLEQRVRLLESDLFESMPATQYDLIVSNPPYVPVASMTALPKEYHHEPRQGLVAEDNGLQVVRRILHQASAYLARDGLLVMEVGEIADSVMHEFGGLELMWCDLEHGGDGIFAVHAEELRRKLG